MILLGVVLLAPACGDSGGALTTEQYFIEVEAAAVAYDEGADAAEVAGDAIQDPIASVQETLKMGAVVLRKFVSKLDSLPPPVSLTEEHSQAVATGQESVAALDGLIAEVNRVDTMDDLNALAASEVFDTFGESSDQFTDSCWELTRAAADRGIEVDLRCG